MVLVRQYLLSQMTQIKTAGHSSVVHSDVGWPSCTVLLLVQDLFVARVNVKLQTEKRTGTKKN